MMKNASSSLQSSSKFQTSHMHTSVYDFFRIIFSKVEIFIKPFNPNLLKNQSDA